MDATSPDHQFRCWTPVGTPENRAALEANRAAGLESALAVVEDVLPAGVSTATETLPQVTTSHLRGGTINPKGSV